MKRLAENLVGPLLAIICSLIICSIFIYALGKDALEIYSKLFSDSFGNSYGIGQVLFKATPLIFTGLSVAFAFKAGMFNIGAEGQVNIGAFFTAWAGFTFTSLPFYLLIPLCVLSGFIGGALWASIAGYLKARFGSHEVINTIMLNFIALALVSYLVNSIYHVPATIRTPEISGNAFIAQFDDITGFTKGSPFNFSIVIALLCCLIFYFIISKTKPGYEIKTLGQSRNAAEYARMNVKKLTITSMAIAGGFAGLAGTNFVMGYKHYFELGFSEGVGYLGIAVALISRNNPFAIIVTAIFFGVLEYGGLTVNTLVPKEIVMIMQAMIILFVIVFSKIFEKKKIFTAKVMPINA